MRAEIRSDAVSPGVGSNWEEKVALAREREEWRDCDSRVMERMREALKERRVRVWRERDESVTSVLVWSPITERRSAWVREEMN